ncbi:ABC transporter permease [Mycobacterium sp.]|jgi:hypothetical protein|uniref:ABC transporter permease n=1 Tax=Mycobacterium sp. TaxID=1785 RepID=UPI002D40E1B2|nr:ABC transporter permease [Mycobacterium sp.]HZA08840.1 ABC transporter permease [Mycobacterium sp.]
MDTQSPPRHTDHPAVRHRPPAALRATGIVVGLTVVLAIIAIAFALPAAKTKPRDVPIGAAGPQAAQVAGLLEQNAPGAFAVTSYPDEAALRGAIRDRAVYGGISFGADGPRLLIATGGSPLVAQLLTQVGNGIAQHAGRPLRTEDLAPPTAGDPRGTGLAAAVLPITLAGLLPGIALVLLLPREVWTRCTATVVFSGLAGVTIAALLRYVLGSIDQNFWAVAGGLALGVLAAGLSLLGLGSLFGRVGLVVGALLALLLGNPLSGLNSAPQMLPSGWGTLGHYLPQGANATLLRSTAFFGGAGAGTAIVVLTCWALAGGVLVAIAASRGRA